MACSVCRQENTTILSSNVDCIADALETIKNHYLFFKKTLSAQEHNFHLLQKQNEKLQKNLNLKCNSDKDQQILLLQQRNEKLTKAVALLQRESQKNENQPPPPLKRRKSQFSENTEKVFNTDVTIFSEDDESSKLNMALNSEDLLNSTALSTDFDSTIINFQTKDVAKTSHLLKEFNQNNRKLMTETKESLTKTEWLSKQRDTETTMINNNNNIINLKPTKSGFKRASLSLNPSVDRKGAKLKQTRLQFQTKQEKNDVNTDTICSDEIIVASPHPNILNKNPTRTFLQRKENSIQNLNPTNNVASNLNDNTQIEDDDGLIFQFSDENITLKNVNDCEISNEFELRPDDNEAHKVLLDLLNGNEKDESVLLLTPETQDIVFIDDTLNNSTNINSMDLVQDLIQCGDYNLAKLKRIETETIKQLQKDAEKKKEHTGKSLSTTTVGFKTPLKIKEEPKTQPNEKECELAEKKCCAENEIDKETDSEDEFMVRPIIMKFEPPSPKKIDIKSRYNIDCKDCQKYIEFMGHNMSNQEIEKHLEKCIKHKKQDNYIRPTPDNFWNPFLPSFPQNDPRNEVLIDRRFVNKKRNT